MGKEHGLAGIGEERMESWGTINKARLRSVLAHSGKSVLDVGCSRGHYVTYLCNNGYDACGTDILPNREWFGEYRCRFLVGDVCHLPFEEGSFDTICCFEVLEHVKAVEKALRELHRVSRKNIIISVPHCEDYEPLKRSGLAFHHWVDRSHCHCFDQSQICSLVEEAGFEVAELRLINPIVPEILVADMWRLPVRGFIGKAVARVLSGIPLRKKYLMTILVVAEKGTV